MVARVTYDDREFTQSLRRLRQYTTGKNAIPTPVRRTIRGYSSNAVNRMRKAIRPHRRTGELEAAARVDFPRNPPFRFTIGLFHRTTAKAGSKFQRLGKLLGSEYGNVKFPRPIKAFRTHFNEDRLLSLVEKAFTRAFNRAA